MLDRDVNREKAEIERGNRIEALSYAARHRLSSETASDVVGNAEQYFKFLQGGENV